MPTAKLKSFIKKLTPRYRSRLLIGLTLTLIFIIGLYLYPFSDQSKIKGDQTISRNRSYQESHLNPESLVIGFLPSWEVAKQSTVNLDKLDQLIYFGLGVNDQGELIRFNQEGEPVLEWTYLNSDYFQTIKHLASLNQTKVLIAIKSFDNATIDNLTGNPTATNTLITQILTLIDNHSLDGVNLNFEYVTDIDYPTVQYFNRFLETLSTRLKQHNPELILSIDLNTDAVLNDQAYDLVKIGTLVDQVILMAYDYHRPSSTRAGPVAPLDAPENQHSLTQSVNAFKGRLSKQKLVLGIPFYGYEWQTSNQSFQSPTIPNSGALATYRRVRQLINNRDDLSFNWDELSQSPWLSYQQSGAIKQIYFENLASIQAKIDFVNQNNLGGVAIWALGYEGDYPDLWKAFD